jgi:hypothetical protein
MGSAATSTGGIQGADISWPNCPKGEGIPSRRTEGEPMPTKSAQFVIVGLTNGPGFYPNPCLADQLQWVADRHLLLGGYAMTTYPTKHEISTYGQDGPYDGSTDLGALRNAASAEARYNLSTMSSLGMSVPMIWVDVEPYPVSPWSSSHSANRAVVAAVVAAYRRAGYRVGIYTYPNGWRETVGAWRLPSLPTWSTIGAGSQRHADRACGHGPSGGTDWVEQWWVSNRDKDVICPAVAGRTGRIFSKPVTPPSG